MNGGDRNPATVAVLIRSTIFHIVSFLTALVYCVALPFLFLPRHWGAPILFSFLRVFLWELKTICGLDHEIRGRENIPEGQVLVASKHQSAWETIAFSLMLNDPVFIVKGELFWVPVVGWIIRKMGHLGVQRKSGIGSMANMLEAAKLRAAEGRNLIIFPEGTRGTPDADSEFKQGIGVLYRILKLPCVPVVLNSGQFWPRRSWLRYPGKITVQFLQPIEPGLEVNQFASMLKNTIDEESRKLRPEAGTDTDIRHSAI